MFPHSYSFQFGILGSQRAEAEAKAIRELQEEQALRQLIQEQAASGQAIHVYGPMAEVLVRMMQ